MLSISISETCSTILTTAALGLLLLPIFYYGLLFVQFMLKTRRIGRIVDQFPGPEKHWLFGTLHHVPDFGEKGLAYGRSLVIEHKRAFRTWNGPFRSGITLCHPETAKMMFRSTEPKQFGFTGAYSGLIPWLGDGLLLSSGSKWFRNRKLLTPAFHFDVLKPYMKIYNEAANVFADKMVAASKGGLSVEISQPVSLCTLDIILRCAFSYDKDVQRVGETHPYVNAVMKLAHLIVDKARKPYLHFNGIYFLTSKGKQYKKMIKHVHTVSAGIIAEKTKAGKESIKRYPDFLDILLLAKDETGEGLTDREIKDEVDTFLFEGHDTTGSAILWILYELSRQPENQERCRQEVDALLATPEAEMEWDSLQQIPFLTMFIKECMRLHPPVSFVGRQTTKPFELEGITLQPGTNLQVVTYLNHTNPEVWGEDVLEFKPDRFHPDNSQHWDSYAYIPFAAGPRNCIGQNFAMHEIKVIVARVLRRLCLKLDTGHRVEHKPELVLRAKTGVKVFFTPRP